MKRVLVKFYKKGDASFLSHRETMRALERALRRSGAPLVFTAGYNPRPKVSFAPALPLGVAAEAEYLEVAVQGEPDLQVMQEKMNHALPLGLGVISLQALPPTMPRLSRWARYGLYRIDGDGHYFLVMRLSGEGEGRLKDALVKIGDHLGIQMRERCVTRVGIYASRDEVLEEVAGPVYFYHGRRDELEVIEGDDAG